MARKVDPKSDRQPDPPSAPGEPSRSPDRGEATSALDAVDFELAEVRATQQSSGWTLWAILAAIAANLWLISEIVKQDAVWLPGVRFLFLLMFVAVETAILAALGLGLESPFLPPRPEKRLLQGWLTSSMSGAEWLLDAIKRCVLIWIVAVEVPPAWLRVATYLYLGPQLGFLPVFLLLSWLGIALDRRQTRRNLRHVRLAYVVFVSLGLVILVGLTGVLLRMVHPLKVADYRLAGALVAFAILLGLLARFARRPPTLSPLLEVRRGLAFGHISPDVARQQVERIVVGSRPTELIEDATERVKDIAREIDEAHQRALAAADRLAARHQADGSDGVVPDDEVNRWWRKYVLRGVMRRHKALNREMRIHRVRLFLLTAGGGPEATDAANRLTKNLVLDMAAAMPKQLAELIERSKNLRGKGNIPKPEGGPKQSSS